MAKMAGSIATRVLAPAEVYKLCKSLDEDWPKTMQNLRQSLGEEMIKKPRKFVKILGNEFEDFISTVIPRHFYIWSGRSKPLHGKSCVRHEHDLVIYRWDLKEFPLILECKVRTKGEITLNDIMAFNMKVADIYHSHRIQKYEESLNVKFVDLYRVFVTNAPIEEKAQFFATGFGILTVQPLDRFFPNVAASIYKLEKFMPEERLLKMKRFHKKLYALYDLSFRGHKASTKKIFNGEKLNAIVRQHYNVVNSMVKGKET